MPIQGLDAVSVVNNDRFSVSIVPACHNDFSGCGSHNGGAVRTSDVNGSVPGAVAAADVPIACNRPQETAAVAAAAGRSRQDLSAGIGSGFLLFGAFYDFFRHRLLDHFRGNNGASGFIAVHILNGSGNLLYAFLACLYGFGIAFVLAVILCFLRFIGNGFRISFFPNHLDGEERLFGGDDGFLADKAGFLDSGVQLFKLRIRDAVFIGNQGGAVPLHNGVGALRFLGGIQEGFHFLAGN